MVDINTVLLVSLIVFLATAAGSTLFIMVYSIYSYLQEVKKSEEPQQGSYLMPMTPSSHSGNTLTLSDLMKMYSAAKKEDSKSADGGGTYL